MKIERLENIVLYGMLMYISSDTCTACFFTLSAIQDGMTALIVAASSCRPESVVILLQYGADPEAQCYKVYLQLYI